MAFREHGDLTLPSKQKSIIDLSLDHCILGALEMHFAYSDTLSFQDKSMDLARHAKLIGFSELKLYSKQ